MGRIYNGVGYGFILILGIIPKLQAMRPWPGDGLAIDWKI